MSGTYGLDQTPLKSTLPAAVCGVGPSGGLKSRCAAAIAGSAAIAAKSAMRRAARRVMAALLLRQRRRRIVAAHGSREHAAAVRELHHARVAGLRSVFGERAVDRDRVAHLQRVRAPAVARQRVRRTALALPGLHGAVVVLHIEIDPDVRVRPFELRDRALERDGLVRVEFGGEGVVGDDRFDERERDDNRKDRTFHVHKRSAWAILYTEEAASATTSCRIRCRATLSGSPVQPRASHTRISPRPGTAESPV